MSWIWLPAILAGCGDGVSGLGKAAEAARTATEQMALDSAAANDAREQQAYADALAMQEAEDTKAGRESEPESRYQLRKDGEGWTVYDRVNRRVARLDGKQQSGLSRADAEANFSNLQRDQEAFDQAFRPRR
jgi:hypothetical protein